MQPAMAILRRPYPSDLSDSEWQMLEPLLPSEKPGGGHRGYAPREIVNAIEYPHPVRRRVALAPARLAALAVGLSLLPALEARRDVAQGSRPPPSRSAPADGARSSALGRRHRLAVGEDDGKGGLHGYD